MIFQFNIMHPAHPINSPQMAEFFQWAPRIQALAEQSPGFVWRQTDERDPTIQRRLGPDVFVNLSGWDTVDDLYRFVFHPTHKTVMMQRDRWFQHAGKPLSVMWQDQPEAIPPRFDDAIDRLEQLWRDGPSADAFDLSWAQQHGWASPTLRFLP